MSTNDEDEHRRGKKSNVGREHKPKNSKDHENAPTGHLGMEIIFTPAPGLIKSIAKSRPLNSLKETQSEKSFEKPDNRPLAAKTGDKEVDAHYGKDHRLVTEQELAGVVSPEKQGEKSKSSSKDKMSAQDIFNKFAKDKEHDKGIG